MNLICKDYNLFEQKKKFMEMLNFRPNIKAPETMQF